MSKRAVIAPDTIAVPVESAQVGIEAASRHPYTSIDQVSISWQLAVVGEGGGPLLCLF